MVYEFVWIVLTSELVSRRKRERGKREWEGGRESTVDLVSWHCVCSILLSENLVSLKSNRASQATTLPPLLSLSLSLSLAAAAAVKWHAAAALTLSLSLSEISHLRVNTNSRLERFLGYFFDWISWPGFDRRPSEETKIFILLRAWIFFSRAKQKRQLWLPHEGGRTATAMRKEVGSCSLSLVLSLSLFSFLLSLSL